MGEGRERDILMRKYAGEFISLYKFTNSPLWTLIGPNPKEPESVVLCSVVISQVKTQSYPKKPNTTSQHNHINTTQQH